MALSTLIYRNSVILEVPYITNTCTIMLEHTDGINVTIKSIIAQYGCVNCSKIKEMTSLD